MNAILVVNGEEVGAAELLCVPRVGETFTEHHGMGKGAIPVRLSKIEAVEHLVVRGGQVDHMVRLFLKVEHEMKYARGDIGLVIS